MRHDVGEVVAAPRLQVDVVDRVGQFGGGGDVVAGELEVDPSTLRSTPRAAGRRPGRAVGAASPAASSAARIRCAPRLSPRTTQAQPNPLTMSSATQRVVRGAPRQRGVDVGALGPGEGEVLGLAAAAHTRCRRSRPRPRTMPACAARARSVSPASVIASSANARMLSSSRYRTGRDRAVVVDDHERTAREPPDHVDRRGRRHVERFEDGLDRRRAARHRRTWRAPTGRAGRRGTTARSSTRSSP